MDSIKTKHWKGSCLCFASCGRARCTTAGPGPFPSDATPTEAARSCSIYPLHGAISRRTITAPIKRREGSKPREKPTQRIMLNVSIPRTVFPGALLSPLPVGDYARSFFECQGLGWSVTISGHGVFRQR